MCIRDSYQFDLPPDQRYGHTGTRIEYEYDIGDKVTIKDNYWRDNNEPRPRSADQVCAIVGRFHIDDDTEEYQVQFGKDMYLVMRDWIRFEAISEYEEYNVMTHSSYGNRFCANTWYGTSASADQNQTTSVWIYVYKRTETRVWYVLSLIHI